MKRMNLFTIAVLGLCTLLWTGPLHASSAAYTEEDKAVLQAVQAEQPHIPLEERVGQWIAALAQQEGWESFKSADRDVHTLGPGSHGWIVHLSKDGKPIGYLVISATEDGDYALAEYGKGESPLFSEKTLNDALSRLEVTPSKDSDKDVAASPFYYDALQALWKVDIDGTTRFLDAQTGEELPFDTQLPDFQPALIGKTITITPPQDHTPESLLRDAFDPYEIMSWVQGEPLPITSSADFKQALAAHKRVTYIGDLYQNQYHVPLAVIGFTQWGQGVYDLYVALSMAPYGVRYIPFQTVLALGAFYP